METAVNKLETLFQKATSDLDYIEQKLDFEIKKSLPNESATQENPAKLLDQLASVKSQFKSLSAQLDSIAVDQKNYVERIQQTIAKTVKVVQHLQEQTDFEVSRLSEEEIQALQQFQTLAVKGVNLQ